MYGVLEGRRVDDVGDALVDGHAAADAEDADGDDEAPEVDLHAVAEGVVLVGGRRARRRPWKSRTPLPVSTREWMPSEIIAELPVNAAATNLMTAMARLPMIAAMMAFLDSAAMASLHGGGGATAPVRPDQPRGGGRLTTASGLGDPWLHGLEPERTRKESPG